MDKLLQFLRALQKEEEHDRHPLYYKFYKLQEGEQLSKYFISMQLWSENFKGKSIDFHYYFDKMEFEKDEVMQEIYKVNLSSVTKKDNKIFKKVKFIITHRVKSLEVKGKFEGLFPVMDINLQFKISETS